MTLDQLVTMLRNFLMDAADKNVLKGVEEYSNEQLKMFLDLSLDDWNTTPPPLSFVSLTNHPSPRMLMYGATIIACELSGLLQIRNSLPYNEGGMHIPIMEKGPAYQGHANFLSKKYETQKTNFKIMRNIAQGWGGAPSSEWIFYWQLHQEPGF